MFNPINNKDLFMFMVESLNITDDDLKDELYEKFGISYFMIKLYDDVNKLCDYSKDFNNNVENTENLLKEVLKTTLISLRLVDKDLSKLKINSSAEKVEEPTTPIQQEPIQQEQEPKLGRLSLLNY